MIQYTDKVEGKIVSSLCLYIVFLPSRRLAVIEEVWTDPEFRNQGRATKLIEEAIIRAKELGATCVELTVRRDSPHIKAFYESLGFEDRLQDCMRKKL